MPTRQPDLPPSSGTDKERAGLGQVAVAGIGAIRELGKETLQGLEGVERIVVFAVGVLGVVSISAFGAILFTGGNPIAIVALFAAVVGLLVLMLGVSRSHRRTPPTWRREVPVLPIRAADLSELNQVLQHVCHEAYTSLTAADDSLHVLPEEVRTNVFLADYRDQGDGYAFNLYMPDELRCNMNRPQEWDLRFRPGQGATGLTFVSGSQRVTKRQPDESLQWEAKFELTDEQKAVVHPALKWIVSVPLKDADSGTTLGVMNIDGLNHDIADHHLSQMLTGLLREIAAFSALLSEQPRAALNIHVEEAEAA